MDPRPETNFEFYKCMILDKLAYVTADLTLHARAPDPERPWIAEFRIRVNAPKDNGLPTREESSTIYELEKALDAALWAHCGALRAGMVFSNGFRKVYFYMKADEDLTEVLDKILARFDEHDVELATWSDPKWEGYLETLYPNPLGFQYISDRHTVEALKEEGDPLTTPREVTHWIYLPSEEAQSKFLVQANMQGFKITTLEDSKEGKLPLKVVMSRVDKVTLHSIYPVTEKLWILTNKLGGEYDGWECQVVKG